MSQLPQETLENPPMLIPSAMPVPRRTHLALVARDQRRRSAQSPRTAAAALATIAAAAAGLWCDIGSADVDAELVGVRSAAMGGAHRGVGTSNDTIFLNPAGMAMLRRYAVEIQTTYAPRDGLSRGMVSVVDSKSGPVAGGVAYSYIRGGRDGVHARLHITHGAMAFPISQSLALGVTARNIRGKYNDATGEPQEVDLYNGDVGVSIALPYGFSAGLAYNNVLKTDDKSFLPSGVGIGAAFNTSFLVIASDVFMRTDDHGKNRKSYHLGAEFVAAQAYALRAGFQRTPFVDKRGMAAQEDVVTGGLGALSAGGAIDVTYTQSLTRSKNWTLIGALRFFL